VVTLIGDYGVLRGTTDYGSIARPGQRGMGGSDHPVNGKVEQRKQVPAKVRLSSEAENLYERLVSREITAVASGPTAPLVFAYGCSVQPR
jgi:hypothetical protein